MYNGSASMTDSWLVQDILTRANVGPTDPEKKCADHVKVTPCVRQALGSSQPLQIASFSVTLATMACSHCTGLQVHMQEHWEEGETGIWIQSQLYQLLPRSWASSLIVPMMFACPKNEGVSGRLFTVVDVSLFTNIWYLFPEERSYFLVSLS